MQRFTRPLGRRHVMEVTYSLSRVTVEGYFAIVANEFTALASVICMRDLSKLKEDEKHLWYVLFNLPLPEEVRAILTRIFADIERRIRDSEGGLIN